MYDRGQSVHIQMQNGGRGLLLSDGQTVTI